MTTVTPLGRSVSIDDWKAFQGDVALKILYDYQSSVFPQPGSEEHRLTVTNLYQGSAMGMDAAREVALYLAEQGHATVEGEHVALTPTGLEFVGRLIDTMACPACGR
jgi:hypothetical protein